MGGGGMNKSKSLTVYFTMYFCLPVFLSASLCQYSIEVLATFMSKQRSTCLKLHFEISTPYDERMTLVTTHCAIECYSKQVGLYFARQDIMFESDRPIYETINFSLHNFLDIWNNFSQFRIKENVSRYVKKWRCLSSACNQYFRVKVNSQERKHHLRLLLTFMQISLWRHKKNEPMSAVKNVTLVHD